MIRKVKNIIIYIVAFIVILAFFYLPQILLDIESNNMGIALYEKKKKNSELNIEMEKIYLIQAIHDIEKTNTTVSISDSKSEELIQYTSNVKIREYEKELLSLKEYNILQNLEYNVQKQTSIGIINKMYQNSDKKYIINNIDLTIENIECELEIENKTGKILYISLGKEYFNNAVEKKEILENYIKYLYLNIIDDWDFDKNVMTSKKARLIVALTDVGNKYVLSVHSTDNKINSYVDVTSKL